MFSQSYALQLSLLFTITSLMGCHDFAQFDCFQSSSGCAPNTDAYLFISQRGDDAFTTQVGGNPSPNLSPLADQEDQGVKPLDIAGLSSDSSPPQDARMTVQQVPDLDMSPAIQQDLGPQDMHIISIIDATPPPSIDPRLEVNTRDRTWNGGYCRDVTLTNVSQEVIRGWAIPLDVRGNIYEMWNARRSADTGWVIFTHLDWNSIVEPQVNFEFGFCARY